MTISHFPNPKNENWFARHGSHHTKAFGTVRRYQYKSCRKTFSADYYAKRPSAAKSSSRSGTVKTIRDSPSSR